MHEAGEVYTVPTGPKLDVVLPRVWGLMDGNTPDTDGGDGTEVWWLASQGQASASASASASTSTSTSTSTSAEPPPPPSPSVGEPQGQGQGEPQGQPQGEGAPQGQGEAQALSLATLPSSELADEALAEWIKFFAR